MKLKYMILVLVFWYFKVLVLLCCCLVLSLFFLSFYITLKLSLFPGYTENLHQPCNELVILHSLEIAEIDGHRK